MIFKTDNGTIDFSNDYDYKVATISYDDLPSKSFSEESVIGKDGQYTFDGGYNKRLITVQLQNKSNQTLATRRYNSREIKRVLQYQGELTLNYDSDIYYKARVLNSSGVSFNSNYDVLVLRFRCQPLSYTELDGDISWEDADINWSTADLAWDGSDTKKTFESGTYTITNRGNVDSKPTYVVSGAGTITIGGESFTVTEACSVDTEDLVVSNGSTNKIQSFTGDIEKLTLPIGDTTLTTNVNVTVENKDRWL